MESNSTAAPEDRLRGDKANFGHQNSPMGRRDGALFIPGLSVTKGGIKPR